MEPTRSLQLGAFSLTGIGTLITLPAFLLIEILDRNYTGELFLMSALLMTGAPLAAGGLLILTVDGVLRLTGHRFQLGRGPCRCSGATACHRFTRPDLETPCDSI